MSYMPDYIAEKTMAQSLLDRRQEVRLRRRARHFAKQGGTNGRFYSDALVWLGAHLVNWGSQLEVRHGSSAPDAAPGLLVES